MMVGAAAVGAAIGAADETVEVDAFLLRPAAIKRAIVRCSTANSSADLVTEAAPMAFDSALVGSAAIGLAAIEAVLVAVDSAVVGSAAVESAAVELALLAAALADAVAIESVVFE